MSLPAGTRLGPYQIVSLLGRGGMGEVYRARDPRLDRDVAIKLVPERYSRDADRLRRFEQEARAAAALNHPNIVTVYSVEKADGTAFLTMELIEGRSLAQLISPGGMPVGELLAIAMPLAEAVAAAHDKGITHRDLKPANIMVGDGPHNARVKVLDFGLAKLAEAARTELETALPAAALTAHGEILGTVAYMSPEQAAGKAVDARTDLFSLGVVLYEMATGQRPFKGDSNVAVLSSIIKDTPASITEINRGLPADLGRIIRRCLMKEPARRYQTAADLRNELEDLKQDFDSGGLAGGPAAASPRRSWPLTRPVAIGAVVALVFLAAVGYVWLNLYRAGRATPGSAERAFTQLTNQPGREQFPSLSPDGKWVVFDGNQSGNSDIYLQSISGQKAINLTADSSDDETQPAFSPDGDSIAFRSERQGGGIFVMGRTGESVRRITDDGFTPAWSPDGTRLVYGLQQPNIFARKFSRLWVVQIASGEKHQITEDDGVQPGWSPHGYRIAYWSVGGKGRIEGQRDIYTIPADGGTPMAVTSDAAIDWNPVWSPDGRHLYFSSNRGGSMNLWQIAIDERTGVVSGQPEALTTPSGFAGYLTVSGDGRRIAYASVVRTAAIQKVSFDPESATVGPVVPVLGGSRFLSGVAVSRDGQWLAYYVIGNQLDLVLSRSDGTGERELTHDTANDRNPVWSADGRLIVFFSNRSGKNQIWSIRPDGSQLRQLTFAAEGVSSYNQWSPDGSRMIYEGQGTDDDKWFIFEPGTPWSSQTPTRFSRVFEPGILVSPGAWSPDGAKVLGGVMPNDGIYSFAFAAGRFSKLVDHGEPWAWLNDSRRALISYQRRLYILDTASKTTRELFSIAPDEFDSVVMSSDNRTIYFTRASEQGDLWLATFE